MKRRNFFKTLIGAPAAMAAAQVVTPDRVIEVRDLVFRGIVTFESIPGTQLVIKNNRFLP